MTAELVVFRHAPCAVEGLCYGRTDPPLTMEADEAAESILKCLTVTPDIVWTSPAPRCNLPGQIVAKATGATIRIDHRLSELDFGLWEARSWSDIRRDDKQRFEQWAASWYDEAPPDGEPTHQLEVRVLDWWSSLDRDFNHVLVGHAGVIRALKVITGNGDWREAMESPVSWLTPYRFAQPLSSAQTQRPR